MDTHLKQLLWIFAGIKLLLLGIALTGFFSGNFCDACYTMNAFTPREPIQWWFALSTWDTQHYAALAEGWYVQSNHPLNAFYPLLPVLMRITRPFVFGNTYLAGFVVATIASFGALIGLYSYIKMHWDERIAYTAAIFFMTFPTSFYFHLPYTESLFLLCCLAALWFMEKQRYWLVLLVCIFLPLTRPQGFFMIIPFAIYMLYEKSSWKLWASSIGGLIVGGSVYITIITLATGSAVAGLAAQEFYVNQNSFSSLLHPLQWVLSNTTSITLAHLPGTSMIDRIVFLTFVALLYPMAKLLPKYLFAYSLALGLIPALLGNLASFPRYVIIIFPLYIVLALRYQKRYRRIAIPLFVLQCVLFFAHTMHHWVG